MYKYKTKIEQDLNSFTFDEKCTAIFNWASNYNKTAKKTFDTSTVESIHSSASRWGQPTQGQSNAIDKIVNGYSIDVEKWSY